MYEKVVKMNTHPVATYHTTELSKKITQQTSFNLNFDHSISSLEITFLQQLYYLSTTTM